MNWSTIYSKMGLSAEKYRYYAGTYDYADPTRSKLGRKLPKSHVGWGKRAVEMRANKTHFDCFENDTLGLNEVLSHYRVVEALDKLKEDVLVCGVGFLALAGDRVMPFTAEEATGTYNWYEQNLKDGVAVFRQNTREQNRLTPPDSFIVYDARRTTVCQDSTQTVTLNVTGRPLIGLFTHKATTKQPFGRSVISRPARDAIVDASRAIRQAMVSGYHYNTKVDVILGADNNTPVDKVEAQTGDILKLGTNTNGQIPQIGEFAQHAMAPFNDTILTAARNFCSDTKLNLVNLGIATDAPQSAEALEIVSDDLKDDITEWHAELGQQLKYFAMTLWMNEHGVRTVDDNLRTRLDATIPVWMPVYRADVSKFGDGLTKIAQQAPNIVRARSVWRGLGLTSAEIDQVIADAGSQSAQ